MDKGRINLWAWGYTNRNVENWKAKGTKTKKKNKISKDSETTTKKCSTMGTPGEEEREKGTKDIFK